MRQPPDYVHRRIVIEHGRRYVYLYMTTGDGKLIAEREESFSQPFTLELKEAEEEATDVWDLVYDHLNDTCNFPADDDGDDGSDELQEGTDGEA
jgi:hypothetical protein